LVDINNLGDLWFKKKKDLNYFEQSVTAYPEITKMKITNDMEFVIIACDGVWDCVDIQKFCEYVSASIKNGICKADIVQKVFDDIVAKNNNSILCLI
jgi:protein phosphatase 2C family protein 2/3